MNKKLGQYLCNKYPKIFVDRYNEKSCMSGGFSCDDGWFFLIDRLCNHIQYEIDSPRYIIDKSLRNRLVSMWNKIMWNKIIYPITHILPSKIYYKIQDTCILDVKYVSDNIPQVVFDQVKEKMAELTIYYHGGNEYIAGVMSFACNLSRHVCEKCSKFHPNVSVSGHGKHGGWLKSTCLDCIDKDVKGWGETCDRDVIRVFAEATETTVKLPKKIKSRK